MPSGNQTSGTGVSPAPAQAKACGYHKWLFERNPVYMVSTEDGDCAILT
jgi:hypothetical protein